MPHTTLADLEICLRILSFVNVWGKFQSNHPGHKLHHTFIWLMFSPIFSFKKTSETHHIIWYAYLGMVVDQHYKASSSRRRVLWNGPVRGARPKPASWKSEIAWEFRGERSGKFSKKSAMDHHGSFHETVGKSLKKTSWIIMVQNQPSIACIMDHQWSSCNWLATSLKKTSWIIMEESAWNWPATSEEVPGSFVVISLSFFPVNSEHDSISI